MGGFWGISSNGNIPFFGRGSQGTACHFEQIKESYGRWNRCLEILSLLYVVLGGLYAQENERICDPTKHHSRCVRFRQIKFQIRNYKEKCRRRSKILRLKTVQIFWGQCWLVCLFLLSIYQTVIAKENPIESLCWW